MNLFPSDSPRTARRVLLAHLAGYVTAVTGETLTILDSGGFPRTVLTSSARPGSEGPSADGPNGDAPSA